MLSLLLPIPLTKFRLFPASLSPFSPLAPSFSQGAYFSGIKGEHLRIWFSKGIRKPPFPIQHMPSEIWVPIWLVSSFYPIPDVEMAGVVHELRGAPEYLAMLSKAEDMDIDMEGEEEGGFGASPQQQQQQVVVVVVNARGLASRAGSVQVSDGLDALAAAGGGGGVGGGMPGGRLPGLGGGGGPPVLLVVLDTNILLMKEGLGLLKSLDAEQRGATAGATGAATAEGGSGGGGCKVVFVVPYIVLVELDNLKGRRRDAGE